MEFKVKKIALLVSVASFVSLSAFAGDICKTSVRSAVAAKIRAEKGAKTKIVSIDVTRDTGGNASYSVDVEISDNPQEGPEDTEELQFTATTAIAGRACGVLSLTQTYGD
jgi:hypothetical protein